MVNFIEIDTGGEVSDKLVRDRVVQPVGEPLDSELMKDSLERINGISYFETVVYDIVERDGETGVKITATPKTWGPNYIQFGGRYYNDFSGNDGLTLRFGYLVAPRAADGSEWNTLLTLGEETSVTTDFFKPFSPSSPWFYTAGLFAIQEQVNIFRDGNITSQTEIDSYGAQFEIGRFIGTASEISLGYRAYNGKRNTSIGVGEPPDPNVEGGEIFLDFLHDTFDDISFPRSGHLLSAFALDSGDDWGSNAEFTQYGLDYGGAYDLGRFSLLGGLRANVTPSGIPPPERRFQVGGLFQLGGIAEEEVSANNLLLVRAGVLYPWRQLLGSQSYLGGIASYVTASPDYDDWDRGEGIFAGSLFLGLDTIIGAVYGGIGVNEGGGHSFHLLLGNPF